MEAPHKTHRFWPTVQPQIVRLYKIAGLVALTAILLGLISFLVVNIFYFFDHTWVKPVVLTPTHAKVVEAQTQLLDAKSRKAQLDAEQIEIQAQLAEIDRAIAADDKFLTEVGTSVDAPKTAEQWLVHREVDKARLDRDNEEGKRKPLQSRQASLELRLQDQTKLLQRLQAVPYLQAADHKVVLAFVPYQNLKNVALGTKLYACSWGLVRCHTVGTVTHTIDGEVLDTHPHDESVQRGIMVEIELTTPSAEGNQVLFAGGKPLWLF